jgi:hypothetical protein
MRGTSFPLSTTCRCVLYVASHTGCRGHTAPSCTTSLTIYIQMLWPAASDSCNPSLRYYIICGAGGRRGHTTYIICCVHILYHMLYIKCCIHNLYHMLYTHPISYVVYQMLYTQPISYVVSYVVAVEATQPPPALRRPHYISILGASLSPPVTIYHLQAVASTATSCNTSLTIYIHV